MPTSTKPPFFNALAFFILSFLLLGCQQFNSNVPFPIHEMGYNNPTINPLTFDAPELVQWASVGADSVSPVVTKRFDFKSLPSKPFIIGDPKPLLNPASEKPFDWNGIPDTAFNLENVPSQKLRFRTTLLGAPSIVKLGMAIPSPGASRGVMEASIAFGFPGFGRSFLLDKQHQQLWVATNKGLCRYDGTNIYVYSSDQGLKDFDLQSMIEDSEGNIWVSTSSGLIYKIDFKAGLLSQVIENYLGSNSWGLIQDASGQIWCTRQNVGVFVINTQEGTLKLVSKSQGLINNNIIRVFQDAEGIVWITSGNGFNAIDLKAGKLKRIQKQHGINIDFGIVVMQDKGGQVWLGGNGGVSIIDKQKGTLKLLSSEQGLNIAACAGLLEDSLGNIWMGNTLGEVAVYNPQAGTLETIALKEDGSNTVAHFLFESKNGQIWIGTTNISSYYINTRHGRPGNFTKANGLGNSMVWNVKEDGNGYYWIGTRGGIDVYDPIAKTIKHIGIEQGLINNINTVLAIDKLGRVWAAGNGLGISIIDIKNGTIQYFGKEQGLKGDGGQSLCIDKEGNIWIAGPLGEIQIVDPNTFSIRSIINIPSAGKRIDIITADNKNELWIGLTGGGVAIVDKDRKYFKMLTTARHLSSNDITTIMQDAKENVWVGTQRGLNVVNLKDSTLAVFTTHEGLAHNETWAVNQIGNDIYVGTTLGFSILSPTDTESTFSRSWSSKLVNKEQGLLYVDIAENSTMVTKSGQLWAGVDNQTLVIMDPIESDSFVPLPEITSLSVLDNPLIFSSKSATEDALENIDTLWKSELDSFYANKILPANTGYQAKYNLAWDGVEGPNNMPVNLHLPYNKNFLSFHFASNQTANPEKVRYRYMLEGIDKVWSPISSNSFTENYRDLPPRDYTFKVASIGMNGIWSEPAAFKFTITPPWWESWWAYLFYTIVIGGLLYAIAQYRSRWLKKENRILEEKVSHRTAQLKKTIEELQNTQTQLVQSEKMASLGELTAGIAHEIQNPLNFVNNFSEVNKELLVEMSEELDKGNFDEVKALAKDVIDNEEKIIFHGKRADSIVKGMLQHSRSSTGVKEPTDINALADEYLRLAYHGLRAKDKSFNAGMQTDFDETIGTINVVPQEMGRVILNLITNAFYVVAERKKQQPTGYEPMVKVATKKVDDKIWISVQDNGNGIPQKVLDKIFQPFFTTKPTGEGTGLGLSMSYEIVTKGHNGELIVDTKEGHGATFIIKLPL